MAKRIKEEELTIILKLKRVPHPETGKPGPVTVEARGDYKKEYDDGQEVPGSLDKVVLTPGEETAIKKFGGTVLQQIKDAEGIGLS